MENNKLIAEFMDYECGSDWEKFQTSWDWLMPVVEKIESLNFNDSKGDYSFNVFIIYGDCSIKDDEEIRNGLWICKHSLDSMSKIESTYNAVVEFIKKAEVL